MSLLIRQSRCCKCAGCVPNCTECPCCDCVTCNDGEANAVPPSTVGTQFFSAALAGITIDTACRRYYTTSCVAVPGISHSFTSGSYSATLALKGDAGGYPFQLRDPDAPCSILSGAEVCGSWTLQGTLPTIAYTDYSSSTNCTTGSNSRNAQVWAELNYQASATKHRYILYVFASDIGQNFEWPIFLGYSDFDARSCANYASFPLVMSNIITGYPSCICGGSGSGIRPIGKNGTATVSLVCPGGLAMMDMGQLRGDVAGAADLIASADAAGIAPVTPNTKKGCCFDA